MFRGLRGMYSLERVFYLEVRVWGLGFMRVGFRTGGLGFEVWGSGVQGLGALSCFLFEQS